MLWNKIKGHSSWNPENGNGKKRQDMAGRNNEVTDFISKLGTWLGENYNEQEVIVDRYQEVQMDNSCTHSVSSF